MFKKALPCLSPAVPIPMHMVIGLYRFNGHVFVISHNTVKASPHLRL